MSICWISMCIYMYSFETTVCRLSFGVLYRFMDVCVCVYYFFRFVSLLSSLFKPFAIHITSKKKTQTKNHIYQTLFGVIAYCRFSTTIVLFTLFLITYFTGSKVKRPLHLNWFLLLFCFFLSRKNCVTPNEKCVLKSDFISFTTACSLPF